MANHTVVWYRNVDGSFGVGDPAEHRDKHAQAKKLGEALERFIEVRKIALDEDTLLLDGPVDAAGENWDRRRP